jgi:hypothetical protein
LLSLGFSITGLAGATGPAGAHSFAPALEVWQYHSTAVLVQILRGCLPLSLALLFFRLVWLGLARKYKFTCLYAVAQACISIWLVYQFPNAETISYTWAWTITRWPLMFLLGCAVLEVCRYVCLPRRDPNWFKRLALLGLPGATTTFAAVILWQWFAVDWSSPYRIVQVFQITCLVNSSLFFAVAFFLIVVRLFLVQSQPLRPNVATSWTFLTLYLTVQSVMNFLMNVLNREENSNIGYLGMPLAVAVVVAWSLLLSDERKLTESEVLKPSFSGGTQREDVPRLRLFLLLQHLWRTSRFA